MTTSGATLELNGAQQKVAAGDLVFGDVWHVLATLPNSSPPAVVLERQFTRWSALVYTFATQHASSSSSSATTGATAGPVPIIIRKAVGELGGIKQPYFNFTAQDVDYFKKVANDPTDYAAKLAAASTGDGELDYPSLAGTLAPQRDIASISNAADVVKFGVTHSGPCILLYFIKLST